MKKPLIKNTGADPINNNINKFNKVFVFREPPTKEPPQMKLRVSLLSSDELGDLISLYESWAEYARGEKIYALQQYTISEHNYKDLQARFSLTIKAKNRELTQASILQIPEVKESYVQREADNMYYTLIAEKCDSLEKTLATLSRELTRRSYK